MGRERKGESSAEEQGVSEQGEENQHVGEAEQPSEGDKLRAELAETKERYIRLMADFENFKKRALKEQSELLKYQGERVVVDLLEVLDNLELAIAHSSAEHDKLKAGLEMTQKLFVEKLARWDIKGESGVGKAFDPQKHQAISRVASKDGKAGTIVGELRKAYHYKDKLIRVGEVVVAVGPEEAGA